MSNDKVHKVTDLPVTQESAPTEDAPETKVRLRTRIKNVLVHPRTKLFAGGIATGAAVTAVALGALSSSDDEETEDSDPTTD